MTPETLNTFLAQAGVDARRRRRRRAPAAAGAPDRRGARRAAFGRLRAAGVAPLLQVRSDALRRRRPRRRLRRGRAHAGAVGARRPAVHGDPSRRLPSQRRQKSSRRRAHSRPCRGQRRPSCSPATPGRWRSSRSIRARSGSAPCTRGPPRRSGCGERLRSRSRRGCGERLRSRCGRRRRLRSRRGATLGRDGRCRPARTANRAGGERGRLDHGPTLDARPHGDQRALIERFAIVQAARHRRAPDAPPGRPRPPTRRSTAWQALCGIATTSRASACCCARPAPAAPWRPSLHSVDATGRAVRFSWPSDVDVHDARLQRVSEAIPRPGGVARAGRWCGCDAAALRSARGGARCRAGDGAVVLVDARGRRAEWPSARAGGDAARRDRHAVGADVRQGATGAARRRLGAEASRLVERRRPRAAAIAAGAVARPARRWRASRRRPHLAIAPRRARHRAARARRRRRIVRARVPAAARLARAVAAAARPT